MPPGGSNRNLESTCMAEVTVIVRNFHSRKAAGVDELQLSDVKDTRLGLCG